MGSVNFYLKKPEKSTGKSLIYLQFKYSGQKLVYSFGQTVSPNDWNPKKQRVKSNKQTTFDGEYSLNDLLDKLEEICLRSYKEELKNGVPTIFQLKYHLESFVKRNVSNKEGKDLYSLIERFITGEIKSKGLDKTKGTLDNYKSVYLHLKAFEKQFNYPINYDTITLNFFYKYVSFLKNEGNRQTRKGLSINSIAKDIRILKVFLAEAVDLGLSENFQFKHKKFSVGSIDTDSVYLTVDEIVKLYRTPMPNKKLENVKDLFVFGCFVGLRFSDFTNVRPENIVQHDGDYFIKLNTTKTRELVIIPCNPIVLEIFDKYKNNINRLPTSVSNQKFNDYIKEVLKNADFVEKGRYDADLDKPLFQCVSSHTARRSFATNLYLDKCPTIDIMKITGHKTEKAFMKYIKVTKLDTAKRVGKHTRENWSKMLLRIAN